jgi:hypothetical protein
MSEMRQQTFLIRGSGFGIYYFRRKVPPNLQGIIGKTEIQRSLRTLDRGKALPLARELLARTERDFDVARSKLTPVRSVALKEPARLPTDEDMAYIAGAMRGALPEPTVRYGCLGRATIPVMTLRPVVPRSDGQFLQAIPASTFSCPLRIG